MIFWCKLPLRLASDSKKKLRLSAKFFRIAHTHSHSHSHSESPKVLREENDPLPDSQSLRIKGNDHRCFLVSKCTRTPLFEIGGTEMHNTTIWPRVGVPQASSDLIYCFNTFIVKHQYVFLSNRGCHILQLLLQTYSEMVLLRSFLADCMWRTERHGNEKRHESRGSEEENKGGVDNTAKDGEKAKHWQRRHERRTQP